MRLLQLEIDAGSATCGKCRFLDDEKLSPRCNLFTEKVGPRKIDPMEPARLKCNNGWGPPLRLQQCLRAEEEAG